MSRMIQIRNVPDGIHKELKLRAVHEGMSLSDYLLREMKQLIQRPSPNEMRERLASRARVKLSPRPEVILREERRARDRR